MDERKKPEDERDEPRRFGGPNRFAAAEAGTRGDRLGGFLRGALGGRTPIGGRLAIDGLPDEVAQWVPGNFYAIYAEPRTGACDALIWGTAKEAPRAT
jgi:hypothetical protein